MRSIALEGYAPMRSTALECRPGPGRLCGLEVVWVQRAPIAQTGHLFTEAQLSCSCIDRADAMEFLAHLHQRSHCDYTVVIIQWL